MYSPLVAAWKYGRYWLNASNGRGHGTHSPFVFNFITQILNDHHHYPDYNAVEGLRRRLLKDNRQVEVQDLGAGSGHDKGSRRRIASIARHAAKPPKYGKLLYRIVRTYAPENIMELGSSLGITAAYLSLGRPASRLSTIEGAPSIAALARENLTSLGIRNAEVIQGDFDQVLPALLPEQRWDLVFIDGNHRKEPTLRYFDMISRYTHSGSLLIFDDIHWSREMEQAWDQIRQDPRVRCSIDLFFFGLVFFREEFFEKQDFIIRF